MLHDVPLRAMVNATGLRQGYCSFVRRGLYVPHRRHWAALEVLANQADAANEVERLGGK